MHWHLHRVLVKPSSAKENPVRMTEDRWAANRWAIMNKCHTSCQRVAAGDFATSFATVEKRWARYLETNAASIYVSPSTGTMQIRSLRGGIASFCFLSSNRALFQCCSYLLSINILKAVKLILSTMLVTQLEYAVGNCLDFCFLRKLAKVRDML